MADSQLRIVISADAASAISMTDQLTAAFSQAEATLQKLHAAFAICGRDSDAVSVAFAKTGSASDALATAHGAAAGAAKRHAESETILGASLGRVEGATNALARAFGALGIRSGEATERILGFSEAVKGLEASALPLLAVGAALLAISATIGFMVEGMKDAASEEATLAQIQRAVEAQGGAWDTTKESVEAFTNTLRENSTFSSGEILASQNKFIERGLTAAQAQDAVTAAAKLATAEHLRLSDAVDLLTSAEGSRVKQLERYDPALKALIDRHASFHEIIMQISRDFDGSLAASLDTTQGRAINLGNEWSDLGKHFGELVNGPMTATVYGLDAITTAADRVAVAIGHAIDAMDNEIAAASRAAMDVNGAQASAKPKAHVSKPHYDPYDMPTGNQGHAQATADNEHIRQRIEMVAELYRRNSMTYAEALRQEEELRTQYKLTGAQAYELQMAELHLGDQRASKDHRADALAQRGARAAEHLANKATFDFQPGEEAAPKGGTADERAQKKLIESLKGVDAQSRESKNSIDLATSSLGEYTARAFAANEQTREAHVALGMLSAALRTDKTEHDALIPTLASETRHAHAAWTEYMRYGEQIGKDPSAKERGHLSDLRKHHEELQKALDATAEKMTKLEGYIVTNTDKQEKYNEQLLAAPKAQAHLQRIYNDGTATNARKDEESLATFQQPLEVQRAYYDKQLRDLNKFHADYLARKLEFETARGVIDLKMAQAPEIRAAADAAAQQSFADEVATYKRSLSEQAAYYSQRYAATLGGNEAQQALNKKYFDEVEKLNLDQFKHTVDEHDAYVQKMTTAETSMLDQIITKRMSFRDSLKAIWQEIATDVEKNVATSLVGNLAGANGAIASMFGGGATSPNAQAVPSAIVTPLNSIDAKMGEMVQNTRNSRTDTPGGNQIFDFGANSFLALTGSSSGVSPAALPGGGIDLANASSGTWGTPSPTLGSYVGGAATGAGYGSLVASLDGGNSGNASLFGALGGIVSIVSHANPLAGLGIDIGSALLGSLFGSHATAAGSPDLFDNGGTYGQDYADLMGSQAGANGVNYLPTAATAAFIASQGVGNGGLGQTAMASNGTQITSGGVDAAEMWLAQQNPNSPPPGYTAGEWAQQLATWRASFGSSATGAGQLSLRPGDKNIGDLEISGVGSSPILSTYSTLASQLSQIESAASASGSNTPVYGLTRTYPSYTSSLGPQQGDINSKTGAFTPTGGSAGIGGGGTVVYATVSVTAPTGDVPAATITKIASAIQDIAHGIVPGSNTPALGQRMGGNG